MNGRASARSPRDEPLSTLEIAPPSRAGALLATDALGMTLVNSLCAEISVYQGIGEQTGLVVERAAIRGKRGLCKSMRDLAIKSRVLGDGYYYIPIDLWPKQKEPVIVHKHDWTVISSIPRTSRATKKRARK
jgi:hypothetical protein